MTYLCVSDQVIATVALSCDDATDKETFIELGYTLAGYDILRGYPMEPGHDPGFAGSIFRADYTKFIQTADCKYVHISILNFRKHQLSGSKRSASDTCAVVT